MEHLRKKTEAILFSAGKKVNLEEIAKLANSSTALTHQALSELKDDYSNRDTCLMVVNDGSSWKLIVKDEFLGVVKRIVTETELTKSVMETLAVIAFKYPIKQSDLIKIRTNKAYDHLKELEEIGYITRQKFGRSKLIKLTQKFFEYFDLPEESLKEKFRDFESIANAIEAREAEVEKLKEEQKKKAKEEKDTDERIKEEIESLDGENNSSEDELENPGSDKLKELSEKARSENHLGELEVVDEPSEEEIERENERIRELQDKDEEARAEIIDEEEKESDEQTDSKEEDEGIKLTEEQQDEVEEKVKSLFEKKEDIDSSMDEESMESEDEIQPEIKENKFVDQNNQKEETKEEEDTKQ